MAKWKLKTTPDEYYRAETKALEVLWEHAPTALENPISYGQLCAIVGVGIKGMRPMTGSFWKVLNDVSTWSDARRGPLVSVLVVNQDTGQPGAEFFKTAQRLGRFRRGKDDQEEFVTEQSEASVEWIRAHSLSSLEPIPRLG
jgi:hypothetical protein